MIDRYSPVKEVKLADLSWTPEFIEQEIAKEVKKIQNTRVKWNNYLEALVRIQELQTPVYKFIQLELQEGE